MPNIFRLKQLNHFEQIAITKHANERLKERKITADDIVNCISNGEIIKQYEDDKPLPSCLVLGKSCNGKPLHIVVSNDDNFIYLIIILIPLSGKQISKPERSFNMLCMNCGSNVEKGFTTDVTDLGNCLVIVRNVPCYKCKECNEVTYTLDVVKHLEEIISAAKKMLQEVSIIDYQRIA